MKLQILFFMIGCLACGASLLIAFTEDCYQITALAIGQGDALLIETPAGVDLLLDTGPADRSLFTELGKTMPWWDRSLDLVLTTHPHADHVGELPNLLQYFRVHTYVESGVVYESIFIDAVNQILKEKNITYRTAKHGDRIDLADLSIEFIYPLQDLAGAPASDNVNNDSLAGIIDLNGFRILFTGDLEYEAENDLLATDADLNADLFLAGHHGSRTSNTINFLARASPKYVIVQAGSNNRFKHPHGEAINNFAQIGAEVWRTDLQGQITATWCPKTGSLAWRTESD